MTNINKKLKDKILLMAKKDQEARENAVKNYSNKKLSKIAYSLDQKHLKKNKIIIEKFGWPTFKLVGKKASYAFWLLVQHNDTDLKFQKQCLELLIKAAEENQAKPKNVAFLTDRILAAEDKKQKFGTQYIIKNSKLSLKPVMNRKGLDKLRKKYGMSTIAEQNEVMEREYKPLLK